MRARARSVSLAAASLLVSLTGCLPEADTGPSTTLLPRRDLPVKGVEWSPDAAGLSGVRAVAERGGMTVVFGAEGATLFSGGVLAGQDAGVGTVESAAVIPAADGAGQWIAGADAAGKVWRLVAGESFEVVSSLYGLSEDPVSGIAALGTTGTVFAVESGVAVSDGALVTRHDTGALTGLTATSDRLGGVTEVGPVTFEPAATELTTFEVPGATAMAFDDQGRLLVLTPEALHREDEGGSLVVIYASEAGGLSALAAAPGHVWFRDGTALGLVDDEGVGLSPAGALPEDAGLAGSPTGDVWVLSGGALSRMAIDIGSADQRETWEKDIEPIFQVSCTPCHLPGGSAPVVLSTYDTWEQHRAELRKVVIEDQSMPPPGYDLSDAERATIAAWLDAD
jgi:mono/diheme cytochrome c family protein